MPRVADHRRMLALGAVVAIALLSLLAWKRADPLANQTSVRAAFSDASGLAPVGADVRMAGAVVGRVTGRRRAGNVTVVSMVVDRQAGTIHSDATAELRPRLLFEGTAYVALSPGTPLTTALGARVTPPSQTHSYVSLADALSVLAPPTQAALRTDAHALRTVLSPSARSSLRAVLARSPGMTRALAGTSSAVLGPHGDAMARSFAGLSRIAGA